MADVVALLLLLVREGQQRDPAKQIKFKYNFNAIQFVPLNKRKKLLKGVLRAQ